MFPFLVTNLESFASFNKFNIFLRYLYYSVAINESKEKFKIAFCCFLAIKSSVALSCFSNFPTKFVVGKRMHLFVLINLY